MSNNSANKRHALFHHFSANLHFLKDNGYFKNLRLKFNRTFICPICLEQFSEKDLESKSPNMLTVEHAPPESLGGHGGTLTCKNCNSVAGLEIDSHLVGRLRELDSRKFLPNTETRARVTSGNVTVQGKIKVNENGIMTMSHDIKHNHPTRLAEFIERVEPESNPIIHIEFANKNNKTDLGRWQVGLLKAAYMQSFEKYGYAFLLDGVYDVLREQLKNPEVTIYPSGFWTGASFLRKEYEGVNLCQSPSVEGLYCIIPLMTSVSTRRYGIHLPIPLSPAHIIIKNVHSLASDEGELTFEKDNPNDDFLFNISNINSLWDWFYKVRSSKINNYDRLNIPTAINYLKNPLTKWEYNYFSYPPKRIYKWPPRLKQR